jgi:lipid-A-disaccharide synthase-like uncharacterized protein
MTPDASTSSVLNPGGIPATFLVLGFLGQAMFSCRFLIQWFASERKRASVVPGLFWWFSIAGGLFLLTYAILRRDIVIFVGQAAGLVVYSRNIVLLRRQRRTGDVGL